MSYDKNRNTGKQKASLVGFLCNQFSLEPVWQIKNEAAFSDLTMEEHDICYTVKGRAHHCYIMPTDNELYLEKFSILSSSKGMDSKKEKISLSSLLLLSLAK